jgi:hypothetical protein
MMSNELNNQGIVVLAVYAAGGADRYVDTEDVAVQAAKMAPGRFSWRKYKDQINIDTVRKRLWDAAKNRDGPLLLGSEKEGWLLTEAGLVFAKANAERVKSEDLQRTRQSQREQTWTTRERARMVNEVAFQKWNSGELSEITPVEAERLFRIDDYVIGKARASRLKRALDTFTNDPMLGKAIEDIAKLVRDR